jgi:hypothetical protein
MPKKTFRPLRERTLPCVKMVRIPVTRPHVTEERIPQEYRCENVKFAKKNRLLTYKRCVKYEWKAILSPPSLYFKYFGCNQMQAYFNISKDTAVPKSKHSPNIAVYK